MTKAEFYEIVDHLEKKYLDNIHVGFLFLHKKKLPCSYSTNRMEAMTLARRSCR